MKWFFDVNTADCSVRVFLLLLTALFMWLLGKDLVLLPANVLL